MNFQTDHFNQYYFLTDGGMETTLVFHEGFTIRHFAAFELLNDEAAKQVLRNYYLGYMDLARKFGMGFILSMPTWRASSDWGVRANASIKSHAELNESESLDTGDKTLLAEGYKSAFTPAAGAQSHWRLLWH